MALAFSRQYHVCYENSNSSAVSATAQVRSACSEGSHVQCLSMTVKHCYLQGRCKTWTLDSGLDHGLDYGLEYGLDYGLENT